MKKPEDFVWYATHPQIGELVMVCKPGAASAFVYSPRMIRERLGEKLNPVFGLELGLGPIGFIPRHIYMECGMTVKMPPEIRMITIIETYRFKADESSMKPENDKKVTAFMLDAWNHQETLPV